MSNILELPQDRPLAVYTAAGGLAFWAQPAKARALLASGGFRLVGTKKRIRGLMAKSGLLAEAQLRAETERIRSRGLGDPHRRESYTNPRGVWTLDRIPEQFEPLLRKRAA